MLEHIENNIKKVASEAENGCEIDAQKLVSFIRCYAWASSMGWTGGHVPSTF